MLLQTGKPVVCRLCRDFSFCLCLVLVQGREFKWEKYAKRDGDLVYYIFDFHLKKKKKPMISHFLYCPAQVSRSDGSVLLFRFPHGPGEPE